METETGMPAPRRPDEPPPAPTAGPFDLAEEAPVALGTRVQRFARRPWYTRAAAVIIAVTALAGGLRLWHLSQPKGYVFDEVYYAKDGCYDAGVPFKLCHLDNPGEQTVTVHPPIGREIIAEGERLFGNDEFGWRIASAVFGTLSVLAVTLIAWKLFESVLWGGVAGLLLATENLNLVQSRISMLDIFVTAFVVTGFLFLLLDRRWIDRRTPPPGEPTEMEVAFGISGEQLPSPILRPWRIAAGAAFGLAMATKWSGALGLLAAIVLTLAWERTRRSHAGSRHPVREALRDEAFGIFVLLVLLPLSLYLGSYVRWFAHNGFDLQGWWQLQRSMADYSLSLRATHPYASPAWTWILMWRPVSYFYTCPTKTGGSCLTVREILGMGSPLIFWASVVTVPYAALAWVRRRDWRAGFVVVALAVQYLPWFLARRTSFLFYMAPVTPFMVLALVYSLRDLSAVRVGLHQRSLGWAAAGVVALALAVFAFFWPVLVGQTLSYATWKIRIWFDGSFGPNWV